MQIHIGHRRRRRAPIIQFTGLPGSATRANGLTTSGKVRPSAEQSSLHTGLEAALYQFYQQK